MRKNRAILGDHNMYCDRCGVKAKRSDLVYDGYHGLWVHPWEYDGPHPIDAAPKSVDDEEKADFIRAEPPDRFTATDVNGGTVGSTPTTYEGSVASGTFTDETGTIAKA